MTIGTPARPRMWAASGEERGKVSSSSVENAEAAAHSAAGSCPSREAVTDNEGLFVLGAKYFEALVRAWYK